MQRKLWAKFDYDASTGKLWHRRNGREAGCKFRATNGNTQYRSLGFEGKSYLVHRLIWMMVHGVWPIGHMDHMNGDGLDNRLSNLRVATPAQNQANSNMQKNNTSGYKGVYYVLWRLVTIDV